MSETAALPDDAYPARSLPLWPLAAGLALAVLLATMATVMTLVVRSDVSAVERRVHKAAKIQKSVSEDIASLREDLQALQAQPDPLPEPPPPVAKAPAAIAAPGSAGGGVPAMAVAPALAPAPVAAAAPAVASTSATSAAPAAMPIPAARPMPVALRGPAADAPPPPLPVCVFRTGSQSDLTDCIKRQQATIAARAPQVRYH